MTDATPRRPEPLRPPRLPALGDAAQALAEDTVASATWAASEARQASLRHAAHASEVSENDGQWAIACASLAAAEANLAVSHEVRALRLMLTQQLQALRAGR